MTPPRRTSPARGPASTGAREEAPAGAGPGTAAGADARIVVRVTPRGGADAVEGVGPEGELLLRVRAAPVDGGANRAVLRLLADALGTPVTSLLLEAGEGSRTKRIRVPPEAVARLRARWPGVAVSTVGAPRRSR